MVAKKQALGRGLGALIPTGPVTSPQPLPAPPATPQKGHVRQIPLDLIDPNPYQPRQFFDDEHLEELAASIRSHGVLQPLLLREENGRYQLVAGERRWRAAKLAGLASVPALLEDFSSQDQLEVALIENIQREDLNAMEEARAYRDLVSRYNLSQEEVANRVGKGRATVANALRLLKLPVDIQQDIEAGRLTAGHGRAILSLESSEKQRRLHKAVLAGDLNVREAERLARRLAEKQPPRPKPAGEIDPQVKALEDKLIEVLGAFTRLKPTSPTQGRIEITYNSLDDLDRILLLLGVEADAI